MKNHLKYVVLVWDIFALTFTSIVLYYNSTSILIWIGFLMCVIGLGIHLILSFIIPFGNKLAQKQIQDILSGRR